VEFVWADVVFILILIGGIILLYILAVRLVVPILTLKV